jgi:hypothetical protein
VVARVWPQGVRVHDRSLSPICRLQSSYCGTLAVHIAAGSAGSPYRFKFADCLAGAVPNSYPKLDLLWDNVIAGPWTPRKPAKMSDSKSRLVASPTGRALYRMREPMKPWRQSASDLRRSLEGNFVSDPEHWRKRADAARSLADDMKCTGRNSIGQLCAWLSDQVLVSVGVRPRSFSPPSSALHPRTSASEFCRGTNVPYVVVPHCITRPDRPAARRLNDAPFCGTQHDRIR